MRKVLLGMNVSLDGYVCGPNGELDWLFPYDSEESAAEILSKLREKDMIFLGRVVYQQWSGYWPSQTGEVADMINGYPKVVFSRTLETADWGNARVVKDDLAAEVAAIKSQPGKDIYLAGGADIVHSLTRLGLIDEYQIMVNPVVIGNGKPLFATGTAPISLELVDSRVYGNGVISVTYRPKAATATA